MYRVTVSERGSFRAVAVGADPNSLDLSNSFEVDDWHIFEQELRHRLLNEKSTETPVRETAAGEARRKSDVKLPFTYK